MGIYWREKTGPYKKQLPKLKRRIRYYAGRCAGFYIGITNWPPERWQSHSKSYDEMIVLYKTRGERLVTSMERELIDYFWDDCDNCIRGGAPPGYDPPYFLYIVRRF